jgi:flavin-binding protein dodecin
VHPSTFYSALFSQDKRDEVFVVMSFAQEFEDTWHKIFEPTIRDDLTFKPHRVDYNISGDSIVHDILDGIAHARLVLADITCARMRDTRGVIWPQRNGNVMWELGVAHVMRLPDEVIVIRADNEASIFDLTQFRAFNYDPNDVESARRVLLNLMKDRIKSIEQAKSAYVQRCVQSMDYNSWSQLIDANQEGGIEPVNAIQAAAAAQRLLEMGAITTSFISATPEFMQGKKDLTSRNFVRYKTSEIGKAILGHIDSKIGLIFQP